MQMRCGYSFGQLAAYSLAGTSHTPELRSGQLRRAKHLRNLTGGAKRPAGGLAQVFDFHNHTAAQHHATGACSSANAPVLGAGFAGDKKVRFRAGFLGYTRYRMNLGGEGGDGGFASTAISRRAPPTWRRLSKSVQRHWALPCELHGACRDFFRERRGRIVNRFLQGGKSGWRW